MSKDSPPFLSLVENADSRELHRFSLMGRRKKKHKRCSCRKEWERSKKTNFHSFTFRQLFLKMWLHQSWETLYAPFWLFWAVEQSWWQVTAEEGGSWWVRADRQQLTGDKKFSKELQLTKYCCTPVFSLCIIWFISDPYCQNSLFKIISGFVEVLRNSCDH